MTILLDDGEQERLRRYRRREDQRRFVAGRGLLRLMVAERCGMRPSQVRLKVQCPTCRGPHGRPVLPDAPALQVSLSHSGLIVAAAVGDAPIGLDVQKIESSVDWLAVAAAGFRTEERASLAGLTPECLAAAACEMWVCKEAVLKTGDAGALSPLQVRVAPPGQPPALLDWPPKAAHLHRASLHSLAVPPPFRACLAVLGSRVRVFADDATEALVRLAYR